MAGICPRKRCVCSPGPTMEQKNVNESKSFPSISRISSTVLRIPPTSATAVFKYKEKGMLQFHGRFQSNSKPFETGRLPG